MAHYSGDYASATTVGQVVHESRLELARLLLADFDPSVCGIFAQPLRMAARIDGKVRSHVPDFLLVMRSETVRVVNAKPASRLTGASDRAAWLGVRDLVGSRADPAGEHQVPGRLSAPRCCLRR
ncbi:hypothetical protein ABZZ80_40185 [Streptomyces sp. NPDC006356]